MEDNREPQRAWLLASLFLGVLMAALDIAVLGPAIPAIRESFSIDDRAVAWLLNAFVLANLAGVPIMSKLADVYGHRRIYLYDVSLFALGGVTVAVAPTFTVVLIGRAMQGLAASGIFPVAASVVGAAFDSDKRGRALGVLGAVFGIAFIIGPILAGVLLLVGWRSLYLAYVPLAIAVVVLGVRFVPPGRRKRNHPFDVQGIGALVAMLLSLAYGIGWIDTGNLTESLLMPRVWLSLLFSVIFLILFVRAERRARDPVMRLELFKNRQVALTGLFAAGAGINESAFIFFPTLIGIAFGVSKSTASFMLLPMVIAVAIGSPVLGWVLDRKGSRFVVLLSNMLMVIGIGGIAAAPEIIAVFYVSSVMVGFGLSGIMGSGLSYILLHESRAAERTVSQGLITLFISIGQLVGAAAIGAIAASKSDSVEGFRLAFLGIAILTSIFTIGSMALKSQEKENKVLQG